MRFSGTVKKGSDRGKSLGFPTANINPPQDLEDGLYVGLANDYPSLIFVGANVTFGESDRRAEIYLLDFNENIYGHEIEIETIKKLREPIKFKSAEELVEQMQADEKVAREFFSSYNQNN